MSELQHLTFFKAPSLPPISLSSTLPPSSLFQAGKPTVWRRVWPVPHYCPASLLHSLGVFGPLETGGNGQHKGEGKDLLTWYRCNLELAPSGVVSVKYHLFSPMEWFHGFLANSPSGGFGCKTLDSGHAPYGWWLYNHPSQLLASSSQLWYPPFVSPVWHFEQGLQETRVFALLSSGTVQLSHSAIRVSSQI